MSIIAQYAYKGNEVAVKVTDVFVCGGIKYAAIETLDKSNPFFTIGSKVSRFTPWATVPANELRDVLCDHERTYLEVTGFHSPWDDVEHVEYCLDCGEKVYRPVPEYALIDVDEPVPF